jgi:hypothetical protein
MKKVARSRKKAVRKKAVRKKAAPKKAAPKKTARKKATRGRGRVKSARKAARRKTTRRLTRRPKPRRTPKPPGRRPRARMATARGAGAGRGGKKKDTVQLIHPTGPDHIPHLSVSGRDSVRWWNRDTIEHTLTFGGPIFEGGQTVIVIAAGKHSSWFTIDGDADVRTYSYGITPAFPNQGPPDPPEVVADP